MDRWLPFDAQAHPATRARATDPDTSHEAAAAIGPQLRRLQLRVLALFEECGPMTQHTLIERYRERFGPAPESTVRTRCAELADAGLLVQMAARVQLPSGRRAVMWRRA